jgi:amino acid transporter
MSLVDRLLGKPLASSEEEGQKIGVLAGVPILGLDGLSSAAYGPEAALTILLPLGVAGLNYIGPITLVILALLTILYFSYRQTIVAYPNGGGSYTVARENLGTQAGLLAAAALMLDYVLNVAVGISAGIEALVSAVPQLHPHTLTLCLATLALITLVNLRGLRESGMAFALPTYLFVGMLGLMLTVGLFKMITSGGHPTPVTPPPPLPVAKGGAIVLWWLLLRSFASGCTAMTGVEAVSNGVNAFAAPSVKNAQRTLTAIVVILGALLAGIAYLAHAYGIGAPDPDSPQAQSVISQLVGAVFGRGMLYYVTLGSVLVVLALSANTSFAGFPRLCRLIAHDDFMPHSFSLRGRRLVYSTGIFILAAMSALLLIAFGGITDRLIPLFAVGAFLAFTLSQAGMVMHWRRQKAGHSGASMLINGLGALCTAVALGIILVAKFVEGAWITVLLIPLLMMLFNGVKRHYEYVERQISCPRPLNLAHIEPPVVVVPLEGWNILTERAFRFGLKLSPDVIGVHVVLDDEQEEEEQRLRSDWATYVEAPIKRAGMPTPQLKIIPSPYRRLFTPLLDYINELKAQYPDRPIAVIIPELMESKWYQYFLHNQRATQLKAALLVHGDRRVVVINTPWYLSEDSDSCVAPPAHKDGGTRAKAGV